MISAKLMLRVNRDRGNNRTTAERAAALECRRRVAWLHPRLCASRGRRQPAAATSFSGMEELRPPARREPR